VLLRLKTTRLGQWYRRHASFILAVVGPALGAAAYLNLFSYPTSGSFYRPELIFEFGILLYFALIMSIFQRWKLMGMVLTSVALLCFYTIVFGKYLILDEPVSLFDLRLLDELIFVLPYGTLVAAAVLAAGFGYLFIKNLRWPKANWMWVSLAPFLGFALCLAERAAAMKRLLRVADFRAGYEGQEVACKPI